MSRKKGKAPSGTWISRELYTSRAFWALSGTAKGMLILFLSKRDMSKNHEVLNRHNITLTYLGLENLFNCNYGEKPKGLSRGSISRGISDLMAKGFVEIVRQGGAYQNDKTIYGLTDEWKWWSPGTVFRERQIGKNSGYYALQKQNEPPQPDPYTPPQPDPKTLV